MTLLESFCALAILGLSAVGYLEVFQGASRSAREAEAWARAVGYAEAAMETSKLETAESGLAAGVERGYPVRVTTQPWGVTPDLLLVTVSVSLPRGGSFVLHRLTRKP